MIETKPVDVCGEYGLTRRKHEGTFWGDGNIYALIGCLLNGYIHLSDSSIFVCLGFVHFIVYKFYLSKKKISKRRKQYAEWFCEGVYTGHLGEALP